MVNRHAVERFEYQSDRSLLELAAFVEVVEANGFTAAARRSGARKATLSLRVGSLEQRLGVSLLVRTTRSIRLTDEGRAYFELAQHSVTAARDAEAVLASAKAKPSGLLRITAPASVAEMLFESVIVLYLARHPEVSLQLDTSMRRIDLAREHYDLAVRLGPLEDSAMVARRLGTTRGGYYASPRYLALRGTPTRPDELAPHDTIATSQAAGPIEWTFVADAKKRSIAIRPRLTVNSLQLAARAAAAGLGIVRCPQYFAEPFLANKQLVPLLRDFSPPSTEVHALIPSGGTLVPKTRIFLDQLITWFHQQEKPKPRRSR